MASQTQGPSVIITFEPSGKPKCTFAGKWNGAQISAAQRALAREYRAYMAKTFTLAAASTPTPTPTSTPKAEANVTSESKPQTTKSK